MLPTKKDFNKSSIFTDTLAGTTVAIIAIPLALGFGVASGVGAAEGIYTAIIAGFIAALFGGSNFQVSGPTGAMTAVLVPIVHQFGAGIMPVICVYAGLILIAASFFKIGKFFYLIPWPVIIGFTNGIAIVICLQQLPLILDATKGNQELLVLSSIETINNFTSNPNWHSPAIAIVAIFVMLFWGKVPILSRIPAGISALFLCSLVSLHPIFSHIQRIGILPQHLPMPQLILIDPFFSSAVFRAAVAVAVLAAIESILSAMVADNMTDGSKHDSDRELFGQGLANVCTGFFAGMPATAALARTAVNVRSGARTRLAAMTHSLIILAILIFFADYAKNIPIAALGGILVVVAFRMFEYHEVKLITHSTKSDAAVMLITMCMTVIFDLIIAIEVGIICACILFIIRAAKISNITFEPFDPTKHNSTSNSYSLGTYSKQIVLYKFEGHLFFGATHRLFGSLDIIDDKVKIVILRMSRVSTLDATAITAMLNLVEKLAKKNINLMFSGLNSQPYNVLVKTKIIGNHSTVMHYKSTKEAIHKALEFLDGQAAN